MCHYDLRTLDVRSRCPECGTPIARSVRGPLLRYGAVRAVRCLYRGLWLVQRSTMVAAIVLPILLIAMLVAVINGLLNETGSMPDIEFRIAVLINVVALWGLVATIGFCMAGASFRRLWAQPQRDALAASWLGPLIALSTLAACMAWFGVFYSAWRWSMDLLTLHVAAICLWAQSILLHRFLLQIEARVHPVVLHARPWWTQTELYRIVRRLLRLYHWDAEGWRHASYWLPGFIIGMYWVSAVWGTADMPAVLLLAAVVPLMIMLTKWRLVRALRHERDAAMELSGEGIARDS